MTRPMPEPPECECREVPAHLWTTYAGAVDPNTLFEYTPECPLHGEVSSPKHLTDVECAAHYWQERSALGAIEAVLVSPALIKSRIRTWRRFMDTTHALEVER